MEVPSEIKVVESTPDDLTEKATILLFRDGSTTPKLLICDTTKWYQVELEDMI